ncbi:MAG: AI-2E family transporter [Alphaproteobacteria bacterium]
MLGLAALFWIAGRVAHTLLLLFGAIVVALLLRNAADLIAKGTRLGPRASLAMAGTFVALVLVGFVVLLGAQASAQFSSLSDQLPDAVDAFGNRIGVYGLWQDVVEFGKSSWMSELLGFTPNAIGAMASLVLVLAGGMFLAVDPDRYRDGLLLLVPSRQRDKVDDALADAGRALRLWLIGKLVTMVIVGAATTAGLYAIGLESALALGLIAGLLEFVPFVGPLVAFFPAAVIALSQGGGIIWWVLGLYLCIQTLESYVLMPLIQERAVELPPALGLFALAALWLVFGPLGAILGVPLTVVLMVMVKKLYVGEALGESVHLPGDGT